MSIFKLAYEALICNSVEKKILLIGDLKKHQIPFDIKKSKVNVIKIPSPGRPLKPNLVDFKGAPKRDRSDSGMIKNIHAICHIEFNSINLALDAIYRFQEMPHQYYADWIRVANEETTHFSLIKDYLESVGHSYGDSST